MVWALVRGELHLLVTRTAECASMLVDVRNRIGELRHRRPGRRGWRPFPHDWPRQVPAGEKELRIAQSESIVLPFDQKVDGVDFDAHVDVYI